jgi:hypothetical protein
MLPHRENRERIFSGAIFLLDKRFRSSQQQLFGYTPIAQRFREPGKNRPPNIDFSTGPGPHLALITRRKSFLSQRNYYRAETPHRTCFE